MYMVAEHLKEVLGQAGFACRVTTHSVWENYTQPPASHLVLQLLPAFTQAETHCPVINIKPLLADLNHPLTLDKIMQQVRADYPG
jgi:hypothetical protein